MGTLMLLGATGFCTETLTGLSALLWTWDSKCSARNSTGCSAEDLLMNTESSLGLVSDMSTILTFSICTLATKFSPIGTVTSRNSAVVESLRKLLQPRSEKFQLFL